MSSSVTFGRSRPVEDEYGDPINYNPYANEGSSGDFSNYPVYGEESEKPTTRRGSITTGGGYAPAPKATGQTRSSTWEPSGDAPELGEVKQFEVPEWDTRKIARKAQAKAAPGVRKLRNAMQRVGARSYENPNVKSMTLREALSGYGLGLQGVMAGAESAAQSEYGREYQHQYQAEVMEYQANLQKQMTEYQTAYQAYLREGTTTAVSTSTYGRDGESGERPSAGRTYKPGFNYYQRPNTSISMV